jgi:CopG family nickel-responsive transcriptional regulator
MQRVTITLDDELLSEIDSMIKLRGYQNRSEALRDLARAGLKQAAEGSETTMTDCVAALVYVYDHDARQLAKRLTSSFHDHHDLALSTMHVHLDHDSCMEVAVLRGPSVEVRHLADHVMAERGVRHGKLVTVPVSIDDNKHAHGGAHSHHHPHIHVREAN